MTSGPDIVIPAWGVHPRREVSGNDGLVSPPTHLWDGFQAVRGGPRIFLRLMQVRAHSKSKIERGTGVTLSHCSRIPNTRTGSSLCRSTSNVSIPFDFYPSTAFRRPTAATRA